MKRSELAPGAVIVDDVSKRFRRRGIGTRHAGDDTFAVRNVTFDVEPGEMFGLVGVNGSGKSTLLRMAAGVAAPSSGRISVGGRIAGILSLGDGFHTLLSGRENAMTAAILAGMSRREAEARLPRVLEFSELGDAVDDPVRTYSAGMFVRLAYAVAAHVDADVLLIDEALAVGDLAFATKCLEHLEELRSAGVTIVVASHDLDMVRNTCGRALWLHRGEQRMVTTASDVVDAYQRSSHEATQRLTSPERAATGRLGSGDVLITNTGLHDASGTPVEVVTTGQPLNVTLTLRTESAEVTSMMVSVSVHDARGTTLVDLSHPVTPASLGDEITVTLDLARLDLAAGSYNVAVGAHAPEFLHAYDYEWEAAAFSVIGDTGSSTYLPPHQWRAQ